MKYWSQNDEKIVLFNDPDINIKWPIKVNNVSEKDKKALPLKKLKICLMINMTDTLPKILIIGSSGQVGSALVKVLE